MDPITGAAMIAGGSGILSSIGGIFGASASTRKQYKYQSRLQQQQQAWLEQMSNTAHQREVADLKQAGLNPLLSVMGGNGASTPSAGMGQINAPDYGSSIQEGIATAMQVKQTKAQTNLMNEQAKTEEQKRENFEADTTLKNWESAIKSIDWKYLPEKYKREIENIISQTELNKIAGSATQMNALTNRWEAQIKQFEAETNRKVGDSQAKYTNERARGYSESSSTTINQGSHEGPIGRNSSVTKSKSRTY